MFNSNFIEGGGADLNFEPGFPGRFQNKLLSIKNPVKSFPMQILAIDSDNPRIITNLTKWVIPPTKTVQVGEIIFDPTRGSPNENYLGSSLARILDYEESPLTFLEAIVWARNLKIWSTLVESGKTNIDATVRVRTNFSHDIVQHVKTKLILPSLTKENEINVGVVEIDTMKKVKILFQNPTDQPIHLQFFIGPPHQDFYEHLEERAREIYK